MSHGGAVMSHGAPVTSHDDMLKEHGQEKESEISDSTQPFGENPCQPLNGIHVHSALLMKNGALVVRDGKLLVQTVISVVRDGKDVATLPKELADRVHSLKRRVQDRSVLEKLVYDLCDWLPLTRDEIAQLIGRRDQYVRKLISTMIGKRLAYTIPDMIRHPKQAYRALSGQRPGGIGS